VREEEEHGREEEEGAWLFFLSLLIAGAQGSREEALPFCVQAATTHSISPILSSTPSLPLKD